MRFAASSPWKHYLLVRLEQLACNAPFNRDTIRTMLLASWVTLARFYPIAQMIVLGSPIILSAPLGKESGRGLVTQRPIPCSGVTGGEVSAQTARRSVASRWKDCWGQPINADRKFR